jgi:hypothetical protein
MDQPPHLTHHEERARHRRHRRLKALGFLFLFGASFFGTVFSINLVRDNFGPAPVSVGVGATFSPPYAEELGVDWRAAYLAALDDLGLKRLRLAAYWTMVEPEEGQWYWDDMDWQIDEAEKRGVKVILAVGRKLPRWPECHVPDWAGRLPESDQRQLVLRLIRETVSRYSSSSSVVAWQVENEPFFNFGLCPETDRDFLKREIAVVRSLDSRPVVITESGELSTWVSAASLADVLGVSTYREVWNRLLGYFFWPIGPQVYRHKWLAVSPFLHGIIVSELQAEPWSVGPITAMPRADQERLMNPQRLRDNMEFTARIGFPEIYLWGVEWWYWSKVMGHSEMWDAGREIILQANRSAAQADMMLEPRQD